MVYIKESFMEIGIVLVTYNRKDYLKKALKSYDEQTKKPRYIIVVNNNSTDGTTEVLNEWKNNKSIYDKYVINLEKNIGGSGGFYTGLKESLSLDADWIWVADDDAYPEKNALEGIANFYDNNTEYDKNSIAAICGTVINNNEIDTAHRKRIIQHKSYIEEASVEIEEYNNNSLEIDLFSYVGTVINKEHMEKVGLTEKDYFIYYDDTEHSFRLSKSGKIICLPNVRIIHDMVSQKREIIDWKKYYGIRNKLHFYKKHFPKKYFLKLYYRLKIETFMGKDKIYKKLVKAAIKDAKRNIKGVHNIYIPGWKYTGEK